MGRKFRVYNRNTRRYSRPIEDIHELYDYGYFHGEGYADYSFEAFKSSFLMKLKFLRRFHKGGGRLLDIGCATGLFAKVAQDDGFDAYGVDISEYAVREGKKLLGDKISVANVEEKMPFPNDFFDVITVWDVLENMKHPDSFLNDASRVLKDNGLIFIRTLNSKCLTARLMRESWLQLTPTKVSYMITKTGLEKWLARARLEEVKIFTKDVYLKSFPKKLEVIEKMLRFPMALAFRALISLNLGDDMYCIAKKVPS
jgi:2-polyprenyl-3-methyl-5-hydroxy-6-metoxy-1,4-benzoquinol methylase